MNKHFSILTLLVLATSVLSSCGGADQGAQNGAKQAVLTFYGDSLTAWGTYPQAAGQALGKTVSNYGRPSSMVADELQLNVKRSSAGSYACFIMFGFNDAHHTTDPVVYKENLKVLISSCSENSERVYVATQPQAKVIGTARDAVFAQATRDAVTELNLSNVKLVDIHVQFDYDVSTELTPDQVHFNEAGNAHLTQVWLNNL